MYKLREASPQRSLSYYVIETSLIVSCQGRGCFSRCRNIRLKSSGDIVSNREASRARNSSLGANSWCTEGRADLFHGQHCWQVSHPYTRSPILSATKGAISPLFSMVWQEIHRRASTLPGAYNAPVGQLSIQREQSPHRATTGLSGGRSKEVINSPKKKKEPLPDWNEISRFGRKTDSPP